jgi:curved DNA-binding protein CbpA
LCLDRLAVTGEVKMAYLRAVALLHPSYFGAALTVPEGLVPRIDAAFEKVSRAFSVLVSFTRRVEYDEELSSGGPGEMRRTITGSLRPVDGSSSQPTQSTAEESFQQWAQSNAEMELPVDDVKLSRSPIGAERRRHERFRFAIPVRVTGYDRTTGEWHETTQSVDVSKVGVMLRMHRHARHGTVLHLELPLPVRLRDHSYAGSTYSVYAIVRRVEAPKDGARLVALEFLGEQPPDGFLEKPWATFQPNPWAGIERRRWPREERSEAVWVEYFTESMKCQGREVGRTENVSAYGMRVSVKQPPKEFEVVRVSSPSRAVKRFAALCNRFVGEDGLDRLCLRIIGDRWPIE